MDLKVQFFPEDREYNFLRKRLHVALDSVGRSGRVILGPKVLELEHQISELVGCKYAAGCASGTDAITLALKALGIREGDEVIMPANCYPSVFGVALSGAMPKLVDCDYQSGSIDIKELERSINKRTKAALVVHLYGLPIDLRAAERMCRKHKVLLIEDCAQALGSIYEGKQVGCVGDAAIFSFYPTKNIGAMGDGGMVVTNNKTYYQNLLALRMYGEKERYNSERVGMNSRLDELQAAFLLEKIGYLGQWVKRKQEIASIYRRELGGIKNVELLPEIAGRQNSYHLFPIRTDKRDALAVFLNKVGIQTGVHYPRAIHQTRAFEGLRKERGFPATEKWSRTTLSLPVNPFLSDREIKYVVLKVKEFFSS
jgi:dTDP-4-amino-4,6-dideoxygalactose transaminase